MHKAQIRKDKNMNLQNKRLKIYINNIDGLSTKVTFLVDFFFFIVLIFYFLQNQANFWHTDIFWHDK